MKKILAVLFIVIVAWIFAGRQISQFVDRYQTAEIKSNPVHSISYEGTGNGGVLVIDDGPFSLAPRNPHVGTSKDNQLALADEGKVFAFGTLSSPGALKTEFSNADRATLTKRQSFLGWLTFSDGALHLNRSVYLQLSCKKENDSTLKMTWAIEPHQAERLIGVEISNASR